MPIQLQIKRGTLSNVPSLALGELYFATDTNQLLVHSNIGNLTIGPSVAGSVNIVSAVVDFGFASGNEGDIAVTPVSAAWVTAFSKIVCYVNAEASLDHDVDDVIIEGLQAYAQNLNPGVGFDLVVNAPNNTWGRYSVTAIGY